MPEEKEPTSSFNLRSILGAIKRRRWWVLVTAALVAFLALAVLSIIPKRYTSEATLVMIQQQVPEKYVSPNVTTDIVHALDAVSNEVLTRTKLIEIASEFKLYSGEPLDLVEENMRKKISMVPILPTVAGQPVVTANLKDVNAFKISFVAEDPIKAQAVASRLTRLFIEKNIETREHQSSVTTEFLKEQLDAAEAKLAQQEKRIADFKMQNLGQLPEQQAGTLGALSSLNAQLQNVRASESHAEEQQVYLQNLLTGYRNSAASHPGTVMGPNGQREDPTFTAQVNLARLKQERAAMLATLTPENPEVVNINSQIALAEADLKATRSQKAEGEAAQSGAAATNSEEPAISQVKSQLAQNQVTMGNLAKEAARLRRQIEEQQRSLNLTPVREEQLAGLLRDYETLKREYTDLLSKETQSQLSGDLEKRQEGQQFHLVESPSLPSVPSFPKRLPVCLGGLAGGILLGIALAIVMDLKDGILYTEEDLVQNYNAPIAIAVPVVLTPEELILRKRRKAAEWAVALVLVLTVVGAEFYELVVLRNG